MDPEKLKKLKELLANGMPLPAALSMVFGGDISLDPRTGKPYQTGPAGMTDYHIAREVPLDARLLNEIEHPLISGAQMQFSPGDPRRFLQFPEEGLIDASPVLAGESKVNVTGSAFSNPMYTGGGPGSLGTKPISDVLQEAIDRGLLSVAQVEDVLARIEVGENFNRGFLNSNISPFTGETLAGGETANLTTPSRSIWNIGRPLEDAFDESKIFDKLASLLDPNQMADEIAELIGYTHPDDVMMPRLDWADDLAMEISERLKDVQGGIVHTLDELGNGPLKRFFNTALEKNIPIDQARAMLDTPQRRAIEELSNFSNLSVDEVFDTLWNEADIVRNRSAVVPRVSPRGLAKFAGGPVDELVMEPILGALGRAAQKYIPALASGAARAAGSPIGRTALGALGQIGGAANLIGLAGAMGGSNPINATPMEPLPPIRSPKFIERLFPTPIPRSIKSEAESADRAMLTSAKTLAPKLPLPPRRFRR